MWLSFAAQLILLVCLFISSIEGHCKSKPSKHKKIADTSGKVRCSCGWYPQWNRSDFHVTDADSFDGTGSPQCIPVPNEPLKGYCEASGVCRKRLIKIPSLVAGQDVNVQFEQARYEFESTPVSPYCTTTKWWESAVGCCRTAFCNDNLNIAIVHDEQERSQAGAGWGFPCESHSHCAWNAHSGIFHLCQPKWIPEIQISQTVCCGVFPGDERAKIIGAACCGSNMVCQDPPSKAGYCKCVNQTSLGLRSDGESCSNDTMCFHKICAWNLMTDTKMCCGAKNVGDNCDEYNGVKCCFGLPCTNRKCAARPPLLRDGLACTNPRDCQGGYCQYTSLPSIASQDMNELRNPFDTGHKCCSKVIGESCSILTTNQLREFSPAPEFYPESCCGHLTCVNGRCECKDAQSQISVNPWSGWAEYAAYQICSTTVQMRSRVRDEAGPYCPYRQFSDLTMFRKEPNRCPDPTRPQEFTHCTEEKIDYGHIIPYMGCLLAWYGEPGYLKNWFLNETVQTKPMSPRICSQYCVTRTVPYKFAGVQGDKCGCAKVIYTDKYLPLSVHRKEEECLQNKKITCSGNGGAVCGGRIGWSVFCTGR